MTDPASDIDQALRPLSPTERLQRLRERVPGRFVFTTSLGLEDQVLLHLIAASGIDAEVATLDTGRLFPESYALWAQTEARYGLRIRAYYPETAALEALVGAQGIDGFYASKQARLACCRVRKVEPAARALAGAAVWITGLRADQPVARGDSALLAWDNGRKLLKANPLLDWTRDRLVAFAEAERIAINPLHARGFLSIGCAPCTRAVAQGEPERAGRWWWEQGGAAEPAGECGLHLGPDGRLVRVEA